MDGVLPEKAAYRGVDMSALLANGTTEDSTDIGGGGARERQDLAASIEQARASDGIDPAIAGVGDAQAASLESCHGLAGHSGGYATYAVVAGCWSDQAGFVTTGL